MRIFVIGVNGKPLTPTTPARARMLIRNKKAKKIWSKFNTFGIQMLSETEKNTPKGVLGVDNGAKFEGYSVVIGNENLLNIKLNLPNKKTIVNKLKERREARKNRRSKLRRRETRFNNRNRKGFIAPSQNVLVQIRINMIKNICKIFPIKQIGVEDVCFNHRNKKISANFSTIEVGKNKIKELIKSFAELIEFKGYETKEIRERLEYKKISNKSKNCFESHCCDSLAIASEVLTKKIKPLKDIVVVDKTYLPVRRKIHDSCFSKGGIKKYYSKGTIKSVQKGRKVGHKGINYILSGINKGKYTITGIANRAYRNSITKLDFISSQYIILNSLSY